MDTGLTGRRPAQLLDRMTFASVEAVEIRAPDLARLWRRLTEITERHHDFHLPELVFVLRFADRAFHFNGALHAFGCEVPVALEVFRYATPIKFVFNDRVED